MSSVSPSENLLVKALLGNGRFRYKLARTISHIGNPLMTGIMMMVLFLFKFNDPAYRTTLFIYAAIIILIPFTFFLFLYKKGIVTDIYIRRREERVWPTAGLTVGCILGFLHLWVDGQAPDLFILFAFIASIQNVINLAITTRWKVSLHAGCAASLATWGLILYGAMAIPLVIFLMLVAWSRLYLKRHTPAQIIANIILGGVVPLVVVALVNL